MSTEQIGAFLDKLSDDDAFRESLEAAADADNGAKQVQDVLSQAGFNFSAQDYRRATKALRAKDDLSDEDLESVAGGVSFTLNLSKSYSFFSSGSLLSSTSKLSKTLCGY